MDEARARQLLEQLQRAGFPIAQLGTPEGQASLVQFLNAQEGQSNPTQANVAGTGPVNQSGGLLGLLSANQAAPTETPEVTGPDTMATLRAALGKVPGLNILGNPLNLVEAIRRGDPLGALIAAGNTANTVSGALGGPTLTSGVQDLINLASGAPSAVTSAAAPSVTSGLSNLGANLFNPASIFSTFLGLGGMFGQMDDAKAEQVMLKRLADKVTTSLKDIGQTDPNNLDSLQRGLQALPNLSHAVGLGAEGVNQAIPDLRNRVSSALVQGLDTAANQGVDSSRVTQSPIQLTGDSSIENVVAEGEDPGESQMKRVLQHLLGGEYGGDAENLAQVITATRDQMKNPTAFGGGNPAEATWSGILTHGPDSLWDKVFTPEKLKEIEARGGLGDLANFKLDPFKANDLLNRENKTVSIRNAVGDIGRVDNPLTPPGTTEDDWRMAPRDSTLGHGWMLPPSSRIGEVQSFLDQQGITPGHYQSGIQSLLSSLIRPEWDPFTPPQQSTPEVGAP